MVVSLNFYIVVCWFRLTLTLSRPIEAYTVLAHGIISEYLPQELAKKLHQHLKLPAKKVKPMMPLNKENQSKKQKLDGPTEDYTKDNIPVKVCGFVNFIYILTFIYWLFIYLFCYFKSDCIDCFFPSRVRQPWQPRRKLWPSQPWGRRILCHFLQRNDLFPGSCNHLKDAGPLQ